MGRSQREKGRRMELDIVHRHHDAGVPAAKVSRTGHPGPDLLIAETFAAEVKSRKDGAGFATLERWLGSAALLFLRRDRATPLVVLPWDTYVRLMQGWSRGEEHSASEKNL